MLPRPLWKKNDFYLRIQNEEENGDDLKHIKAHLKDQHKNNINSEINQENKHKIDMQRTNADESDSSSKKRTPKNSETDQLVVNDLVINKKNELLPDQVQNKRLTSDNSQNNEPTSENFPYNRSISMSYGDHQQKPFNVLQKSELVPRDAQNNEQKSKDSQNNISKFDESEKQKTQCNDHTPV